jgi:membrane peptidoglycan carboxypeptidase
MVPWRINEVADISCYIGVDGLTCANPIEGSYCSKMSHRIRKWKRVYVFLAITFLLLLVAWLVRDETRSSRRQARYFSRLAGEMTHPLSEGETPFRLFAPSGPYDLRLGYAALPGFSKRLLENDFLVARQARPSARMKQLNDWGLPPIYREKVQAGLKILDRSDRPIFEHLFPKRVFSGFADIPPIIVQVLLFIENRHLLDSDRPRMNPVIEWERMGLALLERGLQTFDPERPSPGGSTLATQLEKLRHSENGITSTALEKLRQLVSASFRAYLDGEETLASRRRIVLDYINSIPLGAFPEYGEVNGLGDGLWVWYGVALDQATAFLKALGSKSDPGLLPEQALSLKQVLSLFLAHRRPTELLIKERDALNEKCDRYLRLLAKEGIISEDLKTHALGARLVFRNAPPPAPRMELSERKAINAVRTRVLSLLGTERLYDLDRLDLSVKSTLDLPAQLRVTQEILRLHDPLWVAENGLNEKRLIEKSDPQRILYSLTLYERTPKGNLLRVQTDNSDQSLNINEGVKLDLGSSAKLRTLVYYLEIIADLHRRYSNLSAQDLMEIKPALEDRLSQWAIGYLLEAEDKSLEAMLNGALKRPYSASPDEQFFTGGGLHTFENFDKADNHRVMSVAEAFRSSVNLVFIRLMRDVVRYHMYGESSFAKRVLRDPHDPDRKEYLKKFADFEGSKFIRKFYFKYKQKSPEESFQGLVQSIRPLLHRVAAVYRFVFPQRGLRDFQVFLRGQFPDSTLSDVAAEDLYDEYDSQKFSLLDQGYILRVHPLELWTVNYIQDHPGAGLEEVLKESAAKRQEVYRWLFRPSRRAAQETRIRTIFEMEAFADIHTAWKRLGYPFGHLVPSLATAIGSSADRPSALAELMGIILNDGIKVPTYRVEKVDLGGGTPYETQFVRRVSQGEQVLKREIAQVVKAALFDVVRNGTARRVHGAFVTPDGVEIPVGGKTGTGDHRYEIYGPMGRLLASKVVNRTATFAFIIGDRLFGVITAFVPGPEAANYAFTSSLPLAVLKMLAPAIMPLLIPADEANPEIQARPDGGPIGLTGASDRKAVRSPLPHPDRGQVSK